MSETIHEKMTREYEDYKRLRAEQAPWVHEYTFQEYLEKVIEVQTKQIQDLREELHK